MKKIAAYTILGAFACAFAMPTQSISQLALSSIKSHEATKNIALDSVIIKDYLDLDRLVNVFSETPIAMIDDIKIDRNFRDMLVQTVDREATERMNQEN